MPFRRGLPDRRHRGKGGAAVRGAPAGSATWPSRTPPRRARGARPPTRRRRGARAAPTAPHPRRVPRPTGATGGSRPRAGRPGASRSRAAPACAKARSAMPNRTTPTSAKARKPAASGSAWEEGGVGGAGPHPVGRRQHREAPRGGGGRARRGPVEQEAEGGGQHRADDRAEQHQEGGGGVVHARVASASARGVTRGRAQPKAGWNATSPRAGVPPRGRAMTRCGGRSRHVTPGWEAKPKRP